MNTFRQIREKLGVTQTALAESLGVTQGNIAHYESGQTVPPHIAKRLIERASELGHCLTFDDVYCANIGTKYAESATRRKTDKVA